MKGIVLETKGSYTAVLTDDGAVCQVRNHSYSIGEEIIVKNEGTSRSMLQRVGTGVAAVFVFFILTAFAYYTPTGYVSLDVNPSIEYSINMFDRVLKVKAVNGDAVELLGVVDFKNMHINTALEKTTSKLIEKGYITDADTNNIYITTIGKSTKKSQDLAERLEAEVRRYVDRENKAAVVEAEAIGRNRVQEARKLQIVAEELYEDKKLEEPVKVTPGKLNLVQKLIESDEDEEYISQNDEAEIIEWLGKPVKEIQDAIKKNRGKGKPGDQDSQDDSNTGEAAVKPGNGGSKDKLNDKDMKKQEQQARKDRKNAEKNAGKGSKADGKELNNTANEKGKPGKTADNTKEDDD